MPLQYNPDTNQLLYMVIDNENVLMNECCCEDKEDCDYTITATLDWPYASNPDLDLYGKVDATVIYFGNLAGAGLALNHDAFVSCGFVPFPPEIITGTYGVNKTFYFWYNQHSDCASETSPNIKKIEVKNNGAKNICVNGNNVIPNATFTINTLAYAGYDTGAVSSFASGTEVIVTCGDC